MRINPSLVNSANHAQEKRRFLVKVIAFSAGLWLGLFCFGGAWWLNDAQRYESLLPAMYRYDIDPGIGQGLLVFLGVLLTTIGVIGVLKSMNLRITLDRRE